MDLQPHIVRFRRRFSELESELSSPDLYDSPQHAQEVTREHSRLKDSLARADRWEKLSAELTDAQGLVNGDDAEMAAMGAEEIERLTPLVEKAHQDLRFAIVPPDESDSRNTIMEIRAGTGGNEAALFAADLYRMYTRFCETQGWKVETLDMSPGDLGGIKDISLHISGEDVYKKLKYESGVHRVQRVPATEAQGRIHTSTASVAVLPEAKEVDLVIKPEDIRVSVCRSGGPGGQGVNTTDSAVQIMHIPTGTIVRCQDGRSQIKNRESAMNVLRSRLLEVKKAEEEAKYAHTRKSQIGKGGREEKIRTYNYPQNRITDHRINFTTHALPSVLDGDIMELAENLMAADLEEQLAQMDEQKAA